MLKQRPHLIRLISTLLIATVLQACTSWHERPLEPAQFSPSVHPGKARLTLAYGGRVTVLSPVIRGDSLFGQRPPVALALTSIRRVEVEQTDVVGGIFVLFGGLALTVAIIAGAVGRGGL